MMSSSGPSSWDAQVKCTPEHHQFRMLKVNNEVSAKKSPSVRQNAKMVRWLAEQRSSLLEQICKIKAKPRLCKAAKIQIGKRKQQLKQIHPGRYKPDKAAVNRAPRPKSFPGDFDLADQPNRIFFDEAESRKLHLCCGFVCNAGPWESLRQYVVVHPAWKQCSISKAKRLRQHYLQHKGDV